MVGKGTLSFSGKVLDRVGTPRSCSNIFAKLTGCAANSKKMPNNKQKIQDLRWMLTLAELMENDIEA